MKSNILIALSILVYSSQSNAIEITEQLCTDALLELGLATTPYEFQDGWLSDKHVFAGTTECFEKRGNVYISSDGRAVAEDGFFGTAALAARDAALAIQSEKEAGLRKERDEAIEAARDAHDAAVSELNNEVQNQLNDIRENKLPAAVAAAMEAELQQRRTAEEESAQKKAAREAEREKRKAERLAKRAEENAAQAAAELENKRKGFHCLSSWSGTHRDVVRMVERQLNDPDSFKHDETLVAPVENGRHGFVMRYRAKNGFGGVVVGNATGSYGHTDCSDVELTKLQ